MTATRDSRRLVLSFFAVVFVLGGCSSNDGADKDRSTAASSVGESSPAPRVGNSSSSSTPSPDVGLEHTLCGVVDLSALGGSLGAGLLIGKKAVSRMIPPAEDGCIVTYSNGTVTVSASFTPASDHQLAELLIGFQTLSGQHPAEIPRLVDGAFVTDRSAYALDGTRLVDLTVALYDKNPDISKLREQMTAAMRKLVPAARRIRPAPKRVSQPWCRDGLRALAKILGGAPQYERDRLADGKKSCGWATADNGVYAEVADSWATQPLLTPYRGTKVRYQEGLLSNTLTVLLDENRNVVITGGGSIEPTQAQLFDLFLALRSSLGD